MKNWEMVKELMENPKLTFKNLRFGGIVGYREDGALAWIGGTEKNGEAFTIHWLPRGCVCGNWNDEWELVRESVDFMTAVNSDKRISSEDGVIILCYPGALVRNGWLTISQINGKWIIE